MESKISTSSFLSVQNKYQNFGNILFSLVIKRRKMYILVSQDWNMDTFWNMNREIEIKDKKKLDIYILVRNIITDFKVDFKFFGKGNTFSC